MKGDKPNNTSNDINKNKLPEDKVPIIRLKLKVPKTGIVTNDTDKNKSDTIDETNVHVPQNTHNHNTHISSLSSSPTPQSAKFYGTFKYRPFKLFPLLPPSSRYRVLIPSKHTHLHHNPAIKLHYLWKPSKTTTNGVYTDDSDLVCVLIKEGLVEGGNAIRGKNILVEVEVVGMDGGLECNNKFKNNKLSDEKDHNPIVINTRLYDNHDGHYIRIISCSVDPSTVHLKRWRKRKRKPSTTDHIIVTPKFKTKS